MKIEEADRNFVVKTTIQREGLTFFDTEKAPFEIFGIQKEDGLFRRLPAAVAKSVSEGVFALHTNTAGGRVRFATNSPYIAIHAEMDGIGKMPHFPFTGSAGFDLHAGVRYLGTYVPPMDIENGYESVIDLPVPFCDGKMHDYTIHFPLYSNVKKLYIGISADSRLQQSAAYTHPLPVVYYGSSITQGGCASRPGNAYENIVSLRLDCDHINLGFSGNAKAEDTMTAYLATLPMSVFVYDYDHNAPSPTHLQNTHEKLFLAVRKNNPTLPVVFMTRPKAYLTAEEEERLAIVRITYENALASGDENVYFLPGPSLLDASARDTGLVDNCHPNDSGFVSMANAVTAVLQDILKK